MTTLAHRPEELGFDGVFVSDHLPLRGSPEQVAADVAGYGDAGLTYLVVEPRARDTTEFVAQMDRLTREVWPLL